MTDIYDPIVSANAKLLYQAIDKERYISFRYDGCDRIYIPCCLGEGKKEKIQSDAGKNQGNP